MSKEARWDAFVREAILELNPQPREWVGLVNLRPKLDMRGLRREAQDEQLKRMSREGKVQIVPEDNRKVLVAADHEAAIWIGGEPNHLVAWTED